MKRSLCYAMIAVAALLPSVAQGHLLHEQSATMKIVDNSANFVVAVPASVLESVDLDSDGLLSVAEIEAGRQAIIAQFNAGFSVSDQGVAGEQALTWVVSPETHDPGAPTDYVVVMHRVFFASPAMSPDVTFNLFGAEADEQSVRFRAARGEETETVNLTPDANTHAFFSTGTGEAVSARGSGSDYSGLDHQVLLCLALVVVTAVLVAFRVRPRELG